jgi:tellurite resistance protein TehA-like permease
LLAKPDRSPPAIFLVTLNAKLRAGFLPLMIMRTSERRENPPSRSVLRDLRSWLNTQIAALNPGYFALVMATGIISNALFLDGHRELSDALFIANLIAYPSLVLLTLLRFVKFGRQLWADLINPHLVFSFFTLVAGTDVFGLGVSLRGFETISLILWLFALILWFLLIYFSFGVLIFLNTAHGPRAANILHAGFLIAVVGTESLVLLGTVVAPALGRLGPAVFMLMHMLWGVGLALYGIFTVLLAYRIFFFDVEPDDITPPLWLVMGAAAITTNAGSALILTANGIAFLHSMRPFIDGITLVLWAWATWWIPLLVLFGIWKHGVCRVPLTYTPMLWTLVFPLGMYALASLRLSLAADFAPLQFVSSAMVWIALGAWVATTLGFVLSAWRSFRRARQPGRL